MPMLVAVADGDRKYAGYDGGPARNGKGRWRVGEVGEWTADFPPPMAKRDSATGLVWIGWLEECEEIARQSDGSFICVKSKKIWEQAPTPEDIKARAAANKRQYRVIGSTLRPVNEAVTPTADAIARAEDGPATIETTLTPKRGPKPRQQKVN